MKTVHGFQPLTSFKICSIWDITGFDSDCALHQYVRFIQNEHARINNLFYGTAFKEIPPFFWRINVRGVFTIQTKLYDGFFFGKTLHRIYASCSVDDVEVRNTQTICFSTFHRFVTNSSFLGYIFQTIIRNSHCTKNAVSCGFGHIYWRNC